jgi:hypothetical protein
LGDRTAAGVEAGFQREEGAQTPSKVFAAAQAPPAAGEDAVADVGVVVTGRRDCIAGVAHARVDQAVHRDGGRRGSGGRLGMGRQ